MTLLELRDVRASYGESLVLRGMSLDVKRGTVVSLLGRNGMGKSTTVKTIVGALAPSGGLIKLHGQPLSRTASWRIAQLGIGWVPEGRRIFAALSVEENLRVVARPPREGSGPVVTSDRILILGHKFRANIAHRAAYCMELDSHKGFAA